MYTYNGLGVKVVREACLPFPKQPVCTPNKAIEVAHQSIGNEDREVFIAIILDTRNQVLGINTVSIGTLNASIVSPREVFKPPIVMGARAIITAHNHPSNSLEASKDDIEIIHRLQLSGEILGIEMLDSLIFSTTDYSSFKEEDLLMPKQDIVRRLECL